MTDASSASPSLSSRLLLIFLGICFAAMLIVSLTQRFLNPQLVVPSRSSDMETAQADTGMDGQIGALMQKLGENPNDVETMLHLVQHLITIKNWQAAETFAQRALALDVLNDKALYLLGFIKHNLDQNKDAALLLEKALAVKDDPHVRYSLGMLYIYFLNDADRGYTHLETALKSAGADDSLRGRIEDELKKKNAQ